MSGTPTMTCEIFGRRLMDFLEGELDGAARAAMEAHARQCAECGALLADLRRVSAEAGRLPTLSPSRDLWRDIEARIAAPVVPMIAPRPVWRSPRVLGLAMAAAIVFAAALGYEVASRRAPAPVPPAAQTAARPSVPDDAPAAAVTASAGASQATLAADRRAAATPSAVERSYDREIAGLRAVLDTRRSHLDSATVAVIEKNLAVIDSAIAQCKAALAKDPASRYLMQSLSESLDTKVQLLRIAAALPSRT